LRKLASFGRATFSPNRRERSAAMSPFTLRDLSGKVSGVYSDEQKRYCDAVRLTPA
jgi:hypothetical protein